MLHPSEEVALRRWAFEQVARVAIDGFSIAKDIALHREAEVTGLTLDTIIADAAKLEAYVRDGTPRVDDGSRTKAPGKMAA